MATVLAISSQVARGHVGLSAIVPVLWALGHDVIALPTTVLSNHPGHAHLAGTGIEAGALQAMLDALERNGWLAGIDAVLTGYLPTARHVELAAGAVASARRHRRDCLYLCDPILGDDPKGLYIAREAADAIRDRLLPLADCATPNRFELAWLTGHGADGVDGAVGAARRLGPGIVLATSVPAGERRIANIHVSQTGALQAIVDRHARVPNGTGDMMSALLLHGLVSGETAERQLARSVGAIEAVVAASDGRDELALIASRPHWLEPRPASVGRV